MRFRYILYIIVALSLITYIIFKDRGIKDYILLNYRYNQIKLENEKLKKENEKYKKLIEKLKSDKNFIEKIAREKYNMIKKDEILIKIEGKEGTK